MSHSMEDMAKYCDNLIVMNEGEILMEGEPDEVFCRAEELAKTGLDIPQITKLIMILKDHGVELDGSIYTVEQALSALVKKIKN